MRTSDMYSKLKFTSLTALQSVIASVTITGTGIKRWSSVIASWLRFSTLSTRDRFTNGCRRYQGHRKQSLGQLKLILNVLVPPITHTHTL